MQGGFEKCVFLHAGEWEAVVAPGFGMNMPVLRRNGKDVFRPCSGMDALEADPYLQGLPLLFPANRTKGGIFAFEGKEYRLPLNEPQRGNHIHGLMFDAPFTVVSQSAESVCAEYENTGERYPFAFRMRITDALNENGLLRTVEIKNTGSVDMPYTMAVHATFAQPEKFSVPVGERFVCDANYIPTGEMTSLTPGEMAYRTGACPKGAKVSGFYTAQGHLAALDAIVFSVSENFDEWVLFNAGGEKDFLCIEPQCGEVNGLNAPCGHRILQPGQAHVFTLCITGI